MSPMLSTDGCRAQADTPWDEAALPHLLQDHQSLAAQFVNMKQSVQSGAVQRKVLKLKQHKSLPPTSLVTSLLHST